MILELRATIIITLFMLLTLLISYFTAVTIGEELGQGFLVLVDKEFVRVYFRASSVSLNGLSIGDCSLDIPGISLNGVGFVDVNSSGVWLVAVNGVVKVDVALDSVSEFLECVRGVLGGIERRFIIAGVSVYPFKSKGFGGELSIAGDLEFVRDLKFAGDGTSYVLVVGIPLNLDVSKASGVVEVKGNSVLRQVVELKSTDNGLWGVITPSTAWLNGLYYARSIHASFTIRTYAVNLSGDVVACMIGYPTPDVRLRITKGGGEVDVAPWVDYYNVTKILGAPRCIVPYPLYMRYDDKFILLEPMEPWLKGVVEQGDMVEYVANASGVIIGGANFSESPYSKIFGATDKVEFNLASKLALSISSYSNSVLGVNLQLLYRSFKYNPEPKSSTPICLDIVESNCLMYIGPVSPAILGKIELEEIWDELSKGVNLNFYTTTLFYDQLSSYTSIYVSRKPYLALALGLGSYNTPLLGITPRNLYNISIIAFRPQLIILNNTLTIPVINMTMSLDDTYYSNVIVDSFYMLPLLVRTHANNLAITSAIPTARGYVSYSYNVSYNYTLRINMLKGLWRDISAVVASYKPKTINDKPLNATMEVIASCIGECNIESIGGLINITSSSGRPIRLIIIVYGDKDDVRLLANNTRIISGYGEHSLRSILVATKMLHMVNGSLLLFSWTPMLPPRNGVITISTIPYIIEGREIEIARTSYPYRLSSSTTTFTTFSATSMTKTYSAYTETSTRIMPTRGEVDYVLKALMVLIVAVIVIVAVYWVKRK